MISMSETAKTPTGWDESKHPRAIGGTFREVPKGAPYRGSLHTSQSRFPGEMTDSINEAYPVPQANNLEQVSVVVEAVGADVNTASSMALALGLDERQGNYYLSAAGYLGLVESESDSETGLATWSLTALGQEAIASDDDERAMLIAELAASTPAVAAFREGGMDAATNAIAEAASLSDETIARRAACASSWAQTIDAADYLGREANVISIARDRFPEAIAAARAERTEALTARKVAEPKFCDNCFTQLPVTGICTSLACC